MRCPSDADCPLVQMKKYLEPEASPTHTQNDELKVWQTMQQRAINSGSSWDS